MSASTLTFPPTSAPRKASTSSAGLCPFHDGIATLDLLLAELDLTDLELFDAVLDLRSLAGGRDASACLAQLFKVRRLLGGRHYLAFYRVRCWARRTFRIEVRSHRGEAVLFRELPLDGARLDEIVNASLACLAHGNDIPAGAHVRFIFNPAA
jgi:hypothetical protein